jgi:lipid-binding SYLF domain-containing protein
VPRGLARDHAQSLDRIWSRIDAGWPPHSGSARVRDPHECFTGVTFRQVYVAPRALEFKVHSSPAEEETFVCAKHLPFWQLPVRLVPRLFAADREIKVDGRLDASADMMHAGDKGIPQDLIEKAKCVVVLTGMKKAGFIFGAEYGRGLAVCRGHEGSGWSAPAAMRAEGGSFGFQIGATETDVVLLVMNDGGMKHLLSDKFTIGGDARAGADPIGRELTAQTDAMLNAEMLSYSRSRGLFAGVSLESATLRPDGETNRELYGHESTNREILTGDFKTPAAAGKLVPRPS